MLKSYIKVLFRNFARNKSFTLINISGLTLGITCSLVMFLIVKQELSFNMYHSNVDSIYRIGHVDVVDGREYTQGGVPLVMPPAVKEDIVGVKDVTLISHDRYGLISVNEGNGQIKYYEENPELTFIEPNFFDIFDWKVLEGSVDTGLDEPNKVALSETLAEKYFPNESAIGQTIRLNKRTDLQVIAVLEDAPKNSDFPFGIFISMETKKSQQPREFNNWGSISSSNVAFIQVENNVTQEQIEAQFPDFVEKYWDKETREERSFVLSAMTEYHFDDRFDTFSGRDVPKVILFTYAIVGLLLIVTACFNFINMSTAMAVKRAKEVGMRKVLGSSRKQLVMRFIGETFVITLISVLLSMGLTERLLPMVINDFVGIEIPLTPLQISHFFFTCWLPWCPYQYWQDFIRPWLCQELPISALKGSMSKGKGNMFFRRFLVFLQFFLCQFLIFGTVVASRQMNFFLSADMGYDQEWIINVSLRDRSESAQELWASKLENLPGVQNYTFSYRPPFSGSVSSTNGYLYTSDSSRIELDTEVKMADHKYAETYGIELLAGDWLSESDTTNQYVINEEFLSKVGIENPVDILGMMVNVWGVKAPVVGVVKDYHTGRLDEKIEPVTMFNSRRDYGTLGLRVVAASADDVIKSLEKIWYEVNEEYEFGYNFLDEEVRMFYEGEKKMSQLLTVFAGIAIFIGCLGLYGLVAFMANQKAKRLVSARCWEPA